MSGYMGDRDWYCPKCDNKNFGRRTKCHLCDEPRPESGFRKPDDWKCACGGPLNFANRARCMTCGRPKPLSATKVTIAKKPGDWTCVCGEMNFGSREICRKCGAPDPNRSHPSTTTEKCVVCFERDINTCILTCQHYALCDVCAAMLESCPICRRIYRKEDVLKIFKAI